MTKRTPKAKSKSTPSRKIGSSSSAIAKAAIEYLNFESKQALIASLRKIQLAHVMVGPVLSALGKMPGKDRQQIFALALLTHRKMDEQGLNLARELVAYGRHGGPKDRAGVCFAFVEAGMPDCLIHLVSELPKKEAKPYMKAFYANGGRVEDVTGWVETMGKMLDDNTVLRTGVDWGIKVSRPRITVSRPRVTVSRPRVTISRLRISIPRPRVTIPDVRPPKIKVSIPSPPKIPVPKFTPPKIPAFKVPTSIKIDVPEVRIPVDKIPVPLPLDEIKKRTDALLKELEKVEKAVANAQKKIEENIKKGAKSAERAAKKALKEAEKAADAIKKEIDRTGEVLVNQVREGVGTIVEAGLESTGIAVAIYTLGTVSPSRARALVRGLLEARSLDDLVDEIEKAGEGVVADNVKRAEIFFKAAYEAGVSAGHILEAVAHRSKTTIEVGLRGLQQTSLTLEECIVDIHEHVKKEFRKDIMHGLLAIKTLPLAIAKASVKLHVAVAYELLEILFSVVGHIRPLTSAEKAEARKVFGKSIDLGRVRVVENSIALDLVNRINIVRGKGRATEGVATFYVISLPSGTKFTPQLMIHELTHTWQGETMGATYIPGAWGAQSKGGAYKLSKEEIEGADSLTDLGIEKQAVCVECYYGRRWGKLSPAQNPKAENLEGLPPDDRCPVNDWKVYRSLAKDVYVPLPVAGPVPGPGPKLKGKAVTVVVPARMLKEYRGHQRDQRRLDREKRLKQRKARQTAKRAIRKANPGKRTSWRRAPAKKKA